MSKKKGHLHYPELLVKAVLNGTEARALCGYTKVITRESLRAVTNDLCGKCLKKAELIQGDEAVSFQPAADWTTILERFARHTLDSRRPPTGGNNYGLTLEDFWTWEWRT